jgi:hypothetical protein
MHCKPGETEGPIQKFVKADIAGQPFYDCIKAAYAIVASANVSLWEKPDILR